MNTTWNWKNLKEVAFLVIGALLVFSLWSNDSGIDRNYRTNLESRAEDCRLQLGLGIPLSSGCLSDEMKPYFKPGEKITTGAFRAQCSTLRQNNMVIPEGCPDER